MRNTKVMMRLFNTNAFRIGRFWGIFAGNLDKQVEKRTLICSGPH